MSKEARVLRKLREYLSDEMYYAGEASEAAAGNNRPHLSDEWAAIAGALGLVEMKIDELMEEADGE